MDFIKKRLGLIITLVIVAVIVIWGVSGYNGLVSMDEGVQNKWADVETQYQRRDDLIPNLVNTVKGYAAHEKETLEGVVKARSEATSVKIDPENLPGRIIKLPVPAGSYRNFYSDGKKVYYSSMGGTKAFDLKTQKEESVADASFTLTPGSKKALFMKRGQMFVADFPTAKANLREAKISINTPIAKGLLGKKVGDLAEITVPQGKLFLEITSISF